MTLLDSLTPDLKAIADLVGNSSKEMADLLAQIQTEIDDQSTALASSLDSMRAHIQTLEPPPPPPPPIPKPIGLRSGLPWASTWRHPNATTVQVQPAFLSFEQYRGRKLDGLHVFMQGWKNHPLDRWPANSVATAKGATAGGPGEGVLWWLGRDKIDAYITWPLLSDTGVPDGKARFQAVVDGLYDAPHSAVADLVLATGANVRVIRPGHEANMFDSYPWGLNYAEGDFELFKAAYRHIGNLLQAKFPNALLDFNCQRILRNVSSLDDIFPGDPFHIISGEGYGTDDRIATRDGLFAFLNQGTPDLPMGAVMWAAAAAKRGRYYAVPEWSTAVPLGKAATRDIGDFVRAMYEHFLRNSPILAWEGQFGNDALTDGTGAHSFWNPVSCPNASAAYVECWKPHWQ
jgi:hypothetical protein